MAREYQRKKHNPYLLPHNVYMCTLYTVRDYDRLRDVYQAATGLSASAVTDVINGGEAPNPTARNGEKRANILDKLHAIEQALLAIPEGYRHGVKQNIMYGVWYPSDAHVRTYKTWKQRFLYHVAKNLDFL